MSGIEKSKSAIVPNQVVASVDLEVFEYAKKNVRVVSGQRCKIWASLQCKPLNNVPQVTKKPSEH